ncbi:hypothetical protein [Nocardia altamirensis]|nr:hypothetical protein [Nocardia altamirensis]
MLTIVLTTMFTLLIASAVRVFLHHEITLPPLGSSEIADPDAQRAELV